MKLKLTYQIAAFAVSIVLAGCARNDQTATEQTTPPTENAVTASDVKKEVKEAADVTKSYLDKNKDQFIASVDAQLKTLDARINELGQKAEGLKDDAKTEADKVLDGLREKRAELTPKLDELKKSSAQSWQEIKSGFSAAMTDLEKALEEAKNKIRKDS
jgi:CHASE3 domain sensor protein